VLAKTPSRGTRKNAPFRLFQKRNDLFARDTREVLKKFVDRVTAFEIIDKILNGCASARETRRAAHDLRINFDD
jgi:hypothetical protein